MLADRAQQARHGVGEPGAGDLRPDQLGGLLRERREARRGAAEQPALGQRDAQLGERGELGGGLDALGEQPGVDPAGELPEHLRQGHPDGVGVGVADQRPVELDHLRAQGGELLQPRVAAAGVVEGDQGAAAAQLVALAAQCREVVDRGVLGELDDDAVQGGPAGERLLHRRGAEDVRADVDGEEGVGRQRRTAASAFWMARDSSSAATPASAAAANQTSGPAEPGNRASAS